MNFYGYIEGYYGRELTQDERLSLISRLSENKLNSYLIASKEDPWHRLRWRETPPESYFEEIRSLIAAGLEKGVTVIPAVAPGLSFSYGNSEDESLLLERLKRFTEIGAETVALLMDDLPLELPEAAKEAGLTLGEAHGDLLRRIAETVPAASLLFCPTLYTNELLGTGTEADSYLPGLARTAPEEIKIFWTGMNTIGEKLNREHCSTITEIFGDRVIFWDNIYANDYATTRLFVGPFENRDHRFITEETGGIMINPTGMPATDELLIDIFGGWFRSGNSTVEDWKSAVGRADVPEMFLDYLPWFSSPFSFPALDQLREEQLDPMTFFNELIVNWQGELKREWYPYLHRFFTELKLVTEKTGKGPWFEQRFLPHSAGKLRGRSEGSFSIL